MTETINLQTNDQPKKLRSNHLPWLDSLRALAALYVVIHHVMLTVVQSDFTQWGVVLKLFNYTFGYGHYAVGLFIVLSGFSLTIPVARYGSLAGTALDFYKKRARRILPPFYAALFLCLIFSRFVSVPTDNRMYMEPATWKEVATHLVLAHDVYGHHDINYVFWSIAVEWRIYLFFPLLVILLNRIGIWRFLALMVGVAGVWHTLALGSLWVRAVPGFLALFCMGAVSAQIAFGTSEPMKNLRRWRYWGPGCLLSFVAFLAMLFLTRFNQNHFNQFVRDLFPGMFFALFMLTASQEGSRVGKWLSAEWLKTIGTFAYSIYLVHTPVIVAVFMFIVRPMALTEIKALGLMTAICLPAVLCVAYAFFYLFERPFLTPKAKK